MEGYSHVRAIGRDVKLEEKLNFAWRAPLLQEWDDLSSALSSAAQFLGTKPVKLNCPDLVLRFDLSETQRKLLDFTFVPRYSAALEKDEKPREHFLFQECGERMVDLRAGSVERGLRLMWSSTPFDAACGEFAGKPRIFWLRESVAEVFWKMVAAYNAIDLVPQVEDAYRPPAVQEGLFRRRVKLVREKNPTLSVEAVLLEVYAKTAPAPYRAAHMAGAAIDFTLRENDGKPLDLGNPYPTGGAATILEFPYVTWPQFRTRSLFSSISIMAGLFPYPGEDWHVSKGDALAGIGEGLTTVKYCALKDFNRATGEVAPYDPVEARKAYPYEELL
jgi:D-alanyl-D-alanine dipeptidase